MLLVAEMMKLQNPNIRFTTIDARMKSEILDKPHLILGSVQAIGFKDPLAVSREVRIAKSAMTRLTVRLQAIAVFHGSREFTLRLLLFALRTDFQMCWG